MIQAKCVAVDYHGSLNVLNGEQLPECETSIPLELHRHSQLNQIRVMNIYPRSRVSVGRAAQRRPLAELGFLREY
jgi:hypothetical protein